MLIMLFFPPSDIQFMPLIDTCQRKRWYFGSAHESERQRDGEEKLSGGQRKEKKQDPLKNLIENRRKSINWAVVIDRPARCFLQRCQTPHNCDFSLSPPSFAISLVSVTLLFTYHHSVHLGQITLLSPPQCVHSLHFSLTLLLFLEEDSCI